ncbi:hypothetical protein [Streptomyces pratensis]|uniref:hypothetical protein n=1 Tax=Streptomyces pratensis TaxID=1169025 RepID=UPI0019326A98|nr:hypothetical protein [Streptomyces pratensis]
MVQKPQSDAERKERRIDLSLPQVAGSAVAAVAAAVMASQLGVYGTIAGAGVMSVVATCGGSVFQHFFRRTGEQIREVTVQVKHPAGRQVTVRTRETYPPPQRPEDDPTRLLRAAEVTTALRTDDATRALRTDDATRALRVAEPGADRTTVLRQVRPGGAGGDAHQGAPANGGTHAQAAGHGGAFPDDSYSDARTHGTRVRGWKRSALAATGVFVLSMAGITVYEMASGHDLGGNGGTTIGSVVSGERHNGTTPSPSSSPSDGTGQEDDGSEGDDGGDGNTPGSGSTTAPGAVPGEGENAQPEPSGGEGPAVDPAPTPSASGGATSPEATTPSTPGADETAPASPVPTGAGEDPGRQGGGAAGTGAG